MLRSLKGTPGWACSPARKDDLVLKVSLPNCEVCFRERGERGNVEVDLHQRRGDWVNALELLHCRIDRRSRLR